NSLFYSYLLALFFLLFFFCCSRPPRHLHSFPTRRSSDLRPPGPREEPAPHTEVGPVSLAQLQRHIAALGSPPVSTLVGLPLRRDGKAASFGLDLAPHFARVAGKERPGAYLIGLRRLDGSSDRSWMRVQVTDLSLTTLEEPDAVRFAVTSLATSRPVAGASVKVEGTREGEWEKLAEGRTGGDGTF